MKLRLLSVGKPHESIVKEGIEMFTGRLNHYFHAQWELIPPIKQAGSLSETEMKKKEAQIILDRLEPSDYLVLLDERGKTITSEGLAQMIQQRANESTKQLVFLIGGAYGVDATIQQRANLVWSLSPLVFPHQLVRFILAEQLYRACTILKNEKYHHS
jgi:23S rRNA (pseudouridine1915-N3)-methyltransferase